MENRKKRKGRVETYRNKRDSIVWLLLSLLSVALLHTVILLILWLIFGLPLLFAKENAIIEERSRL